jgi:nucleoside-diphosphate-sugar epimerase
MKALVTGASGFIGSYLANVLVQRGYDVYGFVRPTSNVSHLSPKVTTIQGDLISHAPIYWAVQGMDIVYHVAAI